MYGAEFNVFCILLMRNLYGLHGNAARLYPAVSTVGVWRQAVNHRKKSMEKYTDEYIYMVSVLTSST